MKEMRSSDGGGSWRVLLLLAAAWGMVACMGTAARAPVGERGEKARWNPGFHVVVRGETLYSIAWRYDVDYKSLARWNGIRPPYIIIPGQRLRVKPPARLSAPSPTKPRAAQAPPRTKSVPPPRSSPPKAASPAVRLHWQWPAKGPVIKGFQAKASGKKGIVIGGRAGQPVRAAEAGKVVYAGSGLVGYGRLIIIKHNNDFLSAYGHNSKLRVHEGDRVRKGQVIAEMGSSGTNRVQLHFEIRYQGRPVDPLRYLPRKTGG